LGNVATARALADHGLESARRDGWNDKLPIFDALLARIDLAEGGDPTSHLDAVRAWTARTRGSISSAYYHSPCLPRVMDSLARPFASARWPSANATSPEFRSPIDVRSGWASDFFQIVVELSDCSCLGQPTEFVREQGEFVGEQ
jgi:hypothetical protein